MDAGKFQKIGVLGAGIMGPGIAQIFAWHGYQVSLWDIDTQALSQAKGRIRRNFAPFVKLDLVDEKEIEPSLERIKLSTDLDDFCQGQDLVIEAVSERLEVKRQVFSGLEARVSPTTVLASNTSAIVIGKIAEGARHPNRIVGTHFWNPAQVIPCVEVIKGPDTSPEVFQEVYDLMIRAGKKPVKVLKDVPGFLGSRLQQALWREAMKLVEIGVASPADIDALVRHSLGLRLAFLGPFETADLAGLDLVELVQQDLYPILDCSAEPSPLVKEKISCGELGVKTGQGFYSWPADRTRRVISMRDEALLRIIKQLPTFERP